MLQGVQRVRPATLQRETYARAATASVEGAPPDEIDGALNAGLRGIERPLLRVRQPEDQVRDREVRIELERSNQLLDRLVVRAAIVESPSKSVLMMSDKRVELLREQDFRRLLLETAHRREELVIPWWAVA